MVYIIMLSFNDLMFIFEIFGCAAFAISGVMVAKHRRKVSKDIEKMKILLDSGEMDELHWSYRPARS